MRGITYTFLAYFLLLSPAGSWASPVGAVTASQGQTEIIQPGQPGIPAAPGMPVHKGDTAKTGKHSKLEIRLDDSSIIRIGENTKTEISEYLFADDRILARIFLHTGKVRSIVKKAKGLFGMEETNSFEVHTDTAVIGARGTDFVTFREEDTVRSLFITGQGYCYPAGHPEKRVSILSGQSVSVTQTDPVPHVHTADESEIQEYLKDTSAWNNDFLWKDSGPDDTRTASPY